MNFYKYQRSRSFTELNSWCPRFSIINFYSSGLIETKLQVEPVWSGWKKVCSWDLGHMTMKAAIPIRGKLFWKSSQELNGRWPWNLVCSIWASCPTKCVQMMTLVELDLFYDKVTFGRLGFSSIRKAKQWVFFKNSVAAYGIRVDICNQPNELL